jgi:hypothetical protein
MRDYLSRKIIAQRADMTRAQRYMDGKQPMAWIDDSTREHLRDRIRPLNVNLCRVSAEALSQRLRVTGFRSSPGEVVDRELAALWQRNGMDEQSQLVQSEALVLGRSFFMVWTNGAGRSRITAETALQLAVHRDPMTYLIDGALKRWLDSQGFAMSLLITPEVIRTYRARQSANIDPLYGEPPIIDSDAQLVDEQPNPIGRVPVVALVNEPSLIEPDGVSDLVDLFPIVDAIGKLGSDLLISSEFGAFPRRWATGVGDPAGMTQTQAEDLAQRIHQYWERANSAHFVTTPSSTAKFGAFPSADLGNIATAIELLMSQAATVASLPQHFVNSNTVNPTSADAIRASESRLTQKARQRQAWWSGPYEDLMRLARFIETGVEDPNLDDLETLWLNPEPMTVSQTADAQSKLVGAGITDRRAALETLGLSPLEIDRILNEPKVEVL